MKKMPTIFIRDLEKRNFVTDEINPVCQWVFDGEGEATQKIDGTCCMIKDGVYYKRRMVKKGKKDPAGFIFADADSVTGKRFGWIPVNFDNKEDKYHVEAHHPGLPDGTYELIGPKIQGNAESLTRHILVNHQNTLIFNDCPRTYDGLKKWLEKKDIEGVVFHNPDGRMAKIKKRDFGLQRKS